MSEAIVAILVDGPADGEEIALPDMRNRYDLSVQRPIWDLEANQPVHETAVYELVYGHEVPGPVRDEQGRYRYEFQRVE